MLNRREFCIGSAASVAAAVTLTSPAQARELIAAGKNQAGAGVTGIAMDAARARSLILDAYRQHAAERAALGIPPLPLNPLQTTAVTLLLRTPPKGEETFLLELLSERVPPGVDEAAKVKAAFLAAIATNKDKSPVISRQKATELLATMQGGYNVKTLIPLLADPVLGTLAAEGLKKTLLVFSALKEVQALAAKGNANAKSVLKSWAEGEWFTSRPELPKSITLTVFKVNGETNTGDLSPDPDANTRPDIPLHALSILKFPRAGLTPDEPGKRGPLNQLEAMKAKG
jgi:aconitate hydratase 2/2-methylisocitrate dehydratase